MLAPRTVIGEARVVHEMLDLQRAGEFGPILLTLALQQADPMIVASLEIVDQRIGNVLTRAI